MNRVSIFSYWSFDIWKNGKGKIYFCVCVWMFNYDEYFGFKCFVLIEWSCLLCIKFLFFFVFIRCFWIGKYIDLRKSFCCIKLMYDEIIGKVNVYIVC